MCTMQSFFFLRYVRAVLAAQLFITRIMRLQQLIFTELHITFHIFLQKSKISIYN